MLVGYFLFDLLEMLFASISTNSLHATRHSIRMKTNYAEKQIGIKYDNYPVVLNWNI